MTIEEISLMFDYGTKEGRQMALEHLNHREETRGKDLEETGVPEQGKGGTEHVERR